MIFPSLNVCVYVFDVDVDVGVPNHPLQHATVHRYYVVQDGKLRYKIEHNSEIRFDISELRTAVADAVADTAATTGPAIAALGGDDTATRG